MKKWNVDSKWEVEFRRKNCYAKVNKVLITRRVYVDSLRTVLKRNENSKATVLQQYFNGT